MVMARRNKNFYALKKGGKKDIYLSYEICKKNFYPGWRKPLHKGFDTREAAHNWLYDITPPPSPPKAEPKFKPLWTDEEERGD